MINSTKSKYIIAGGQRLGTLMSCDNYATREVRRRIAAANRAFFDLRIQLKSRRLQTKAQLALYKTLILSVALYGHETWTSKEVDRRAFGVFKRKGLRSILGGKGKQQSGIWQRHMNYELHQVYKKMDIVKRIKHGRLLWAGHVSRMPEERQTKIIFSREPGMVR